MAAKRVLIIANKWWEADPLCAVLIHDKARPPTFANFVFSRYPAPRAKPPKPGAPPPPDPPAVPRLSFDCDGARVEVWCIEELMNPAQNSSSTLEKARVLPQTFAAGKNPDLVLAFGTAGSREGVAANGSVVIGRRVFIHDPFPPSVDHQDKWIPLIADAIIQSSFSTASLQRVSEQSRYAAEARLLRSPIAPAEPPLVLLGNGFVSLGVVNITNYDDYLWADRQAAERFIKASVAGQIGSIETTHGLIRSMSECPFLFVSGITDCEGLFDFQVTPRVYGQNFVAAHNAAVATVWLLPDLLR